MNVDVSTYAGAKDLPPDRVGASSRTGPAILLLVVGYATAAIVLMTARPSMPGMSEPASGVALADSVLHGTSIGNVLVFGVALASVLACLYAALRLPGQRRVMWSLFAAAILLGIAGHGVALTGTRWVPNTGTAGLWAFALTALFHPFFALGSALAIRAPIGRSAQAATILDMTLIATAVLLGLGRLVLDPLSFEAPFGAGTKTWLLLAQLGAVATCLVVGLMVLLDDRSIPTRYVLALVVAAAAGLVGTVLSSTALGLERAGPAPTIAWLGAWATLGATALMEVRAPRITPVADRVRDALRRGIAPLAVLVLGLATLDASLNPGQLAPVAAAAMVIAIVLAVRLHLVIGEAERRTEEGVQLSRTRALMELNRALSGATELHSTLDLVSQWACRLLSAGAAGIELLTADGTMLELRAAHGLPPEVIGIRFPVEGSFTGRVVRERRARATLDPGTDSYIHPESASFLAPKATAAAPLVIGDQPLGALFAANRDRIFDAGDLELLASLADQASLAIENAQLFEQVHTLSLTDPLTGLANRRQLGRDLAREFAAAARGRRLVLVLFDLDSFKDYNDRHGHLAGDEALRLFGRVLRAETRAMNLAARYGGDEFLVLVTDSDREGVDVFIQRVEAHFADEIRALGRGDLTVSAGLAEYHKGMTSVEDLIAAADRVLYQIKAGRAASARSEP